MHRFEQVINGRVYLIEVSSVDIGKWRAQIARKPGGSAALMPFYGATPDEAAQGLSRWLALLHGQEPPQRTETAFAGPLVGPGASRASAGPEDVVRFAGVCRSGRSPRRPSSSGLTRSAG